MNPKNGKNTFCLYPQLKTSLSLVLLLASLLFIGCNQDDSSVPPPDQERTDMKVEVLASGFNIPWGVAVITENEFLFTERLGKLYFFNNGALTTLNNIPLTTTVRAGGLVYGGLMDVSLHPQFTSNQLVYISYVGADQKMAVARFKFQNESVQELEVLFKSNAFSIGSRIEWEDDSHFFVTQGLGGNPRPEPGPQDLRNDGGKIHRLLQDGQIPDDNPIFEGFTEPSSIWSYGHRDPQGLFYDRESNILYSNEHGPWGGDELNIITKGGNYGWPLFSHGLNYDGSQVSNRTEEEAEAISVLPVAHWGSEINIAPSGLIKLNNSSFSAWNDSFVMGSLAKQRLVGYKESTDQTSILASNLGRIRDIAQLPSGDLLILIDLGSPSPSDEGRVLKLSPN